MGGGGGQASQFADLFGSMHIAPCKSLSKAFSIQKAIIKVNLN